MKKGAATRGMILRMVPAFLIAVVLVFSVPAVWLAPSSRVAGVMLNAGFPYVQDMRVHSEGMMIRASGSIDLPMMLRNGQRVPLTPGDWHKHGSQTLNIFIVAVAAWAVPAVTLRRRRWMLFPVMLAAALLASGFDIAIETLQVTLRAIGTEWAPSLPLAPTPENVEVFGRIESWFDRVVWIKAYNDGGGRLFSAVLAGLVGYAVPVWGRSRKSGDSGREA